MSRPCTPRIIYNCLGHEKTNRDSSGQEKIMETWNYTVVSFFGISEIEKGYCSLGEECEYGKEKSYCVACCSCDYIWNW